VRARVSQGSTFWVSTEHRGYADPSLLRQARGVRGAGAGAGVGGWRAGARVSVLRAC
jgi:hypothetical protein